MRLSTEKVARLLIGHLSKTGAYTAIYLRLTKASNDLPSLAIISILTLIAPWVNLKTYRPSLPRFPSFLSRSKVGFYWISWRGSTRTVMSTCALHVGTRYPRLPFFHMRLCMLCARCAFQTATISRWQKERTTLILVISSDYFGPKSLHHSRIRQREKSDLIQEPFRHL